ncbi:hypothetical protein M0811_03116 [Anaeramoeba ignava]|uniref:BTB domain-containing protein n=1 Tax=Anaeramoeba ignava TaxID=1746090 RepID=A0A9Q0L5P1_ANAIG|nr:hypothetical protein M0811_03116 [Anaeramoeba ignava]
MSALHLACQNPNISLEIIQLLISNGIDINAKTDDNETALSIVINQNRKDLIQLLLMNDANFFDLSEKELTNQFIQLFYQIYSINQDMNQLLNSNNNDNEDNFSDLQIQSNDSSKFNIHKLILLTRFDNNELILQKFINICFQKPKEDVELILNFLYTGFIDFNNFIQKLNEKKENTISNNNNHNINFKQKKENKLIELFKEIGIDSKLIEIKKGRKGIIKDLSKLYKNETTKDFKIIISNEKEIKVHKLILIIRSELYKGMFLNVKDSSNQVHDYSEKSNETIQQFIYFLYHDKFEKETKEFSNEIQKEFSDLKDYFQLNQNSIIDLILSNYFPNQN